MPYEPKSKSKNMNLLCHAMLELKTVEEAYRLLEDLCTMSELEKISQRMAVAVMLWHKASYRKARISTGASTTTIGRVAKAMKYGNDGFKKVFFRMKDKTQYE
jgi:TrpR-related protein YerC/YecD